MIAELLVMADEEDRKNFLKLLKKISIHNIGQILATLEAAVP